VVTDSCLPERIPQQITDNVQAVSLGGVTEQQFGQLLTLTENKSRNGKVFSLRQTIKESVV